MDGFRDVEFRGWVLVVVLVDGVWLYLQIVEIHHISDKMSLLAQTAYIATRLPEGKSVCAGN